MYIYWFSRQEHWRRQWHHTPVLFPGKSRGWRSLVGCSPWGLEKSDTTEWLHFHFSCIGEGNGNPLQSSCLENPRDGGGWWAAVYGVAQSRTRLKRLSSSRQEHRSPWDSPGKNTGVGCHFLLQWMKVKSEREVAQSCPTLGDPMDCSLWSSSVHGIFQARILEWGAIAFSNIYWFNSESNHQYATLAFL